LSKVDAKNASAVMTTVLPETIRRGHRVGHDEVYFGLTNSGKAVIAFMPGLTIDAPPKVCQWMLQRATANLTGRCPVCDACIDVSSGIQSTIRHETYCNLDGRPDWVARWLVSAPDAV
jgi:hypothetical protein